MELTQVDAKTIDVAGCNSAVAAKMLIATSAHGGSVTLEYGDQKIAVSGIIDGGRVRLRLLSGDGELTAGTVTQAFLWRGGAYRPADPYLNDIAFAACWVASTSYQVTMDIHKGV